MTDDPNVTSTVHWIQSVDAGPHPAGWLPAGTGDFNGDGTAILPGTMRRPAISTSGSCRTAPGPAAPMSGRIRPAISRSGSATTTTTAPTNPLVQSDHARRRSVEDLERPVGRQRQYRHASGRLSAALSGDFNGDGTSDILWYNPTTHAVDIWKIDSNGQWAGSVDVGTHPAGYTPALAGDFNGDGTSDVLWYNPTTGHVDIWKIRTASGRAASMSGPIRSDGSPWAPPISIWTGPPTSPGTIPRPTTSTSG